MKKKGLSPVIATTLLVLLVIVLAVIIFLWARGFLFEQIEKFGNPVKQSCSQVVFDAEVVGDLSTRRVELLITNRGNIDIYQFDVELVKGGNSEVSRLKRPVPSKSAIRDIVSVGMGDTGLLSADELVLFPAIIGSSGGLNKIFSCSDDGFRIVLNA